MNLLLSMDPKFMYLLVDFVYLLVGLSLRFCENAHKVIACSPGLSYRVLKAVWGSRVIFALRVKYDNVNFRASILSYGKDR